jgi:hypothetical protein
VLLWPQLVIEPEEQEDPPTMWPSRYCAPKEQLCNEADLCFCPERGSEL